MKLTEAFGIEKLFLELCLKKKTMSRVLERFEQEELGQKDHLEGSNNPLEKHHGQNQNGGEGNREGDIHAGTLSQTECAECSD